MLHCRHFFLYRTKLEQKCGNIRATEKFFTRMKSLIAVMTSRYAAEALRPDSRQVEVIKEMLDFLKKWESHAPSREFLSESTAEGLRVTLTSTLELLDYLTKVVGFSYVMTSRLSQDKLENFFGIVRMSSGCNAHPTPQQFLLTVNCLSFYNLARSVTGSNVEEDTISSLLSIEDREESTKQKLMDCVKSYADRPAPPTEPVSDALEHPYHVRRSDSRLICHIAGYVARKCVVPSSCLSCTSRLLLPAQEGRHLAAAGYINHNDRGGLLYPSLELFRFITRLEDGFTNCFSAQKLHRESIMDVLQLIYKGAPLQIGCTEHAKSLTPRIVGFYVVMRLHFFVKGLNKSNLLKKRNSTKHLKLSRLN